MNRPNIIGAKYIYNSGTINTTDLTNAQVGLIKGSTANNTLSPNAYTATLASQTDQRNVIGTATDIVLPTVSKLAFAVFLPPFISDRGTLFNFKGSCKFFGSDDTASSLRCYPFIGRHTAGAPVVTLAGAANATSNWIKMPDKGWKTSNAASSQNECIVDEEPLITYDATLGLTFLSFGFCIENPTAGSLKIIGLQSNIMVSKYIADLDCFSALGR